MLTKVANNLWVYNSTFCTACFKGSTRMTVVRLKDGKLWVHSPLEITEGIKEELQSLGDVAYVVAPNNMHYMYFQRFLEVFPQAEGYVAPSLVEKKPVFGQYQPLSELKHVVGREIQQTEFQGHTLAETAFFHKPSKTLIVADLLYNIQPTNLPLEKGVMWVFGAYGKAAIPYYHKVALRDKQAIQASVHRIMEWPIQRVIMAHGDIFDGKDAGAVFGDAWGRIVGEQVPSEREKVLAD